MDAQARQELESIKQDLQNIIYELESIASGIYRDFVGIGNDKSASKIRSVADHYRYVRGKLNNIGD